MDPLPPLLALQRLCAGDLGVARGQLRCPVRREPRELAWTASRALGRALLLWTVGNGAPPIVLQVDAFDLLGLSEPKEREKLEVKRFLNRVLGLPIYEQALCFDGFTQALDAPPRVLHFHAHVTATAGAAGRPRGPRCPEGVGGLPSAPRRRSHAQAVRRGAPSEKASAALSQEQALDAVVGAAKRDGKYDEGMADISGAARSAKSRRLRLWGALS